MLFCYILELLGGERREYMSSNVKWTIYTVLSISMLLILFVAYGVYLYFN